MLYWPKTSQKIPEPLVHKNIMIESATKFCCHSDTSKYSEICVLIKRKKSGNKSKPQS